MKYLWKNYQETLYKTFFDESCTSSDWADWESEDGTNLIAKTYYPRHFIKSRESVIWNDKSCIYNNILYPKTGSNLPCFGMDLMAFFEKKVIIVFDFQHPTENHLVSIPELPKATGEYRFFEPGNHFSENIYVAKCTISEVDDHVNMFGKYLNVYKNMIESSQPTGNDISLYSDFDTYMRRLDPVGGYMSSRFGKEKAESFVNDFLFSYGH